MLTVLPVKEAAEELTDSSQRLLGEAAIDVDHTTDMTAAEIVNRQGSQGFQGSGIGGGRHAEAAPGKAISPASEPCLTVCHTEQKAEVQRMLPGEVHHGHSPDTESRAEAIPDVHYIMAREESGAAVATTEQDKVTKAIAVDQAMEEVVVASKECICAELLVPIGSRWDDEMVLPL